ncbi:MAG: formylmethanofuran dehydrogenase subunit C [Thermoproteota archaeon]
MIKLSPVKKFQFPVMAYSITPDAFQEKTLEEIKELEVWEGNTQTTLGELFKVEEDGEDQSEDADIALQGDLSRVQNIGAKMTQGTITLEGDVGMHLGEEMRGGKITVKGEVSDWAGSMMRGGTIIIHGDAGHYLAASYRGSERGMRGGKIIVHGNVGKEAGAYMRKGLIKVYGNADQFAGFRMRRGTIYIQNDCERRAGACMKKGKIVVGGVIKSVMPTFTIDAIKKKTKIEKDKKVEGPFYRFLGDLADNGRGKLYVKQEKNSHLSHYERYL